MLSRFEYELNLDGARAGVTETKQDGSTAHVAWVYDADNRLVSETRDDSDNALDYTETFAYDLVGNRTEMKEWKATTTTSLPDSVTTYAFDQNDRLLSEVKDAADNSKDTTTVYGYSSTVQVGQTVYSGTNAQGALISRTTYGWNESGRMISQTVEKAGITTVSEYAYNDQGLKVSATEGGHTTTYLFNTQNMTGYSQAIEERTDGTLSKTYTFGMERLAQVLANGVVQNFLTDGQGSTRQMTDANGQVIDIAQNDAGQGVKFTVFEAYGQAMNFAVASAVTSYLYQGMWTNPQGLQNPEQRWTMAGSGRFLSTDPFGGNSSDPASLHRYLFTPSNPVMFRDPNGMFSLTEVMQSMTIMSTIASIGLQMQGTLGMLGGTLYHKAWPSSFSIGGYGAATIMTMLHAGPQALRSLINRFSFGFVGGVFLTFYPSLHKAALYGWVGDEVAVSKKRNKMRGGLPFHKEFGVFEEWDWGDSKIKSLPEMKAFGMAGVDIKGNIIGFGGDSVISGFSTSTDFSLFGVALEGSQLIGSIDLSEMEMMIAVSALHESVSALQAAVAISRNNLPTKINPVSFGVSLAANASLAAAWVASTYIEE